MGVDMHPDRAMRTGTRVAAADDRTGLPRSPEAAHEGLRSMTLRPACRGASDRLRGGLDQWGPGANDPTTNAAFSSSVRCSSVIPRPLRRPIARRAQREHR